MSKPNQTKTIITVAVAAAAVSALTAAFVLWRRGIFLRPHVVTVQEMLDSCHNRVREIEMRMEDLRVAGLGA